MIKIRSLLELWQIPRRKITNGTNCQTTLPMLNQMEISTPVEKHQSDNPKDSLSVLADKLDNLQNFFLTEVSDIKAEINMSFSKSPSLLLK